MPVYLKFLLIFFLFPTVLFWLKFFPFLRKYKKTFLLTVFFAFIFGVPWDMLSVKTGLWWYDAAPTLGVWFGPSGSGLPLEEYLFILIFPMFVATITLIIRERLKLK
ncbi:MAG: lycopene cyclase domain-containing protein [bacterium]|nr:lycopene cyclase domain-containing protein [bacterium]